MTEQNPRLDALFKQLSREENQDADARDHARQNEPAVVHSMLREREREYTDVEKHFIRTRVWLKMAQKIKEANGRQLKYLTLPSYYRLDVSLFIRENLLSSHVRDGREITSVVAFETQPERFARMAGQEPGYQLFGLDSIENAMLDGNNAYYRDLLTAFPFDLVNLDLTSTLTPAHEGPYSRTMQAVDAVFPATSWQ